MTGSTLTIPNLGELGVPQHSPQNEPDIETIWRTPYPVIKNYRKLVSICDGLTPFGGGDRLSQRYKPGRITSGYRSEAIEGNLNSPHRFAIALDIFCGFDYSIYVAEKTVGKFKRVGLYLTRNIIHVDIAPDDWIAKYKKRLYWLHDGEIYTYYNSLKELVRNARKIT